MKRSYTAPVIIDYGSVARLTQGRGGSGVDSTAMGAPSFSMAMFMHMRMLPFDPLMPPFAC
ncbi:MAG: lasso RiPP family leader peptide-containing protein [Acidimicrobiia bacterium]|nr:lasso RiPP family leader peptide-containing protein [Acidimicrobiia bacterium]